MSDAKPLTTAEASTLGEAFENDEALQGSVVVDRDELLATTKALEAVTSERDDARAKLDAVREELLVADGNHCLDREDRDAARATVAELVAALERFMEQGEGCPACGMEGRPGCGCRQEQGRNALAKVQGGGR